MRPDPCDAGGRARPSRRPRDLGAPRWRGVRAPRRIPAAGAREDAPPSGRPRAERPRPRPARLRGTRPARLPRLWNPGTRLRASSLSRLVLPQVPVRQWVLSFPRRVRFLAARHPALASRLLDLFTRAVFAWQRRSAWRLGAADPRNGGVTAVQRFGGALNVHFHTLVPDGVFILDGPGPPSFVAAPPPRDEDVGSEWVRSFDPLAFTQTTAPTSRRVFVTRAPLSSRGLPLAGTHVSPPSSRRQRSPPSRSRGSGSRSRSGAGL